MTLAMSGKARVLVKVIPKRRERERDTKVRERQTENQGQTPRHRPEVT